MKNKIEKNQDGVDFAELAISRQILIEALARACDMTGYDIKVIDYNGLGEKVFIEMMVQPKEGSDGE